MSKFTINVNFDPSQVLRDGLAAEKRAAMRSGVILRAQTIPDRRKVADKKACRKGARWD